MNSGEGELGGGGGGGGEPATRCVEVARPVSICTSCAHTQQLGVKWLCLSS